MGSITVITLKDYELEKISIARSIVSLITQLGLRDIIRDMLK